MVRNEAGTLLIRGANAWVGSQRTVTSWELISSTVCTLISVSSLWLQSLGDS